MLVTLHRAQRKLLRLIIGTPRRRHAAEQHRQPTNTNNNTDATTDNNDVNATADRSTENDIGPRGQSDSDNGDDDLESWVHFIRRSTTTAIALAKRARVDDWTDIYCKRKWQFAARIANHDPDRWTRLIVIWDPSLHDSRPALRRHGGQKKLWADDIVSFLQSETDADSDTQWWELAQNRQWWDNRGEHFLQYMRCFIHSGHYS